MASDQSVGAYAFLAGAAIAIIVGALSGLGQSGALGGVLGWIPLVLVILGLVVGYLNIKDKQITDFLIASIVFITLAGTAGGLGAIDKAITPLGGVLVGVVQNLAVFVAPAALVVAIKAIKELSQGQ